MSGEIDILRLVMNAGPMVKLVMALLLLASVFSWGAILDRSRAMKRAWKQVKRFEKEFWQGGDMAKLFKKTETGDDGGMGAIFVAGFREFLKSREGHSASNDAILNNSRRAMRVAMNRELDKLESHLPFLATVGSTSPYVGLFGTVWGIMNAFTSLGDVKQASLNMVAPGIAEALVATALGLFAAIPAVIAYNRFTNDVDRLEGRYEDFIEELSNILQRQMTR